MKTVFVLLAATVSATALAGPFDQFKGKMKPGMYETKMSMEIPGLPAGMGAQNMTFQNCVTEQDIENGKVGKDDKKNECEVKDFKMSGNTASYTTACKGNPPMTADVKMAFVDNGYNMDMKMNMQGQVMTQRMEGRYLGPCKK